MSEDIQTNDGIQTVENLSQSISFKIPGLPGKTQPQTKIQRQEDEITECDVNKTSNTQENDTEKPNDNRPQHDVTKMAKHDTKEIKYNQLSPAERLKQSQAPIPYKEPSWGGIPDEKYSFDVLKNGVIIETIDLEKSFYVFGRLPSCDITMDHPSLSRYHAVVQYCKIPKEGKQKGWYLYDLDSTHGTLINKNKTFAKKYYKIRVGHIVKFGGSSRLHILQGPSDDAEEESDLSITEMKELREKQKKEAEILRLAGEAEQEKTLEALKKREEEETGCSWGMGDDAEDDQAEESGMTELVTPEMESLYIDDPKKALKGYFEREGYEAPEYEVEDAGRGKYRCTVELPLDTPTGQPMVAEATVSGKKRDAVVQCALEACRLLDRQGVLRASKHESHKRKKKNWEEDDFYDSDEDTFLDRTGNIEKKRQQRMRKAGKIDNKTETYQSLIEKHEKITSEIKEIETQLEKAKADAAAMQDEEVDALDAYMSAIKSGMMDTKTKMKLKRQLMELKMEEAKVRKLVNIAKPATLPELKKPEEKKPTIALQSVPVVGKIKKPQKTVKIPVPLSKPVVHQSSDQFEEEEEDEEEEESKKQLTEVCNKDTDNRLCSDASKIEQFNVSGSVPPNKKETSEQYHTVNISDDSIHQKEKCEVVKTKPARKRPSIPDSKQIVKKKPMETYDDGDPDFAVWLPPTDQSGDGKTHLNAKFGY